MPRPGLRTLDRHPLECRLKKFNVVGVGAPSRDAQRNAASVGENRTFGTELTTIGRILAGIFPRPEAICSSLRPCSASSSQSLFARRIRAAKLSKSSETHLWRSTPDSSDAGPYQTQTPAALPSTGCPCEGRSKSLPSPSVGPPGGVALTDSICSAAITA